MAKHLDEQGLTQTGDLLGTPSYIAPELTRGVRPDSDAERIGDVYSLGAILYELLTGRAPFLGATVADTFEQVRSMEPMPPRRLCPQVPIDMETICLKCLAKDPKRRYCSAIELAEDLQRFLDGRPIHARRIGPLVRLGKWARRRPALAALSMVLSMTILAAVGGGIEYQRRLAAALETANANAEDARRSRDRADVAYRAARETLEGILKLIEDRSLADIPRLKELQRRQLEEALGFYTMISERQGDDPSIRYDAALAAYDVGRLQDFLGRTEDARQNYQKAVDSLVTLVSDMPDDAEFAAVLADALVGLSGLDLSSGAHETAMGHALQALQTVEPFSLLSPLPEAIRSSLALAHHRLGTIYMTYRGQRAGFSEEEDWLKAVEHTVASHDLIQQFVEEEPNNQSRRNSLAKLQINLSVIYQQRPEHFEKCRFYRDLAEQTLQGSLLENPLDISAASDLAILRVNWAFVQESQNELDQALLDLADCLAKLEELILIEPQYEPARDGLFRAHGVRAQILDSMERFEESAVNWEGCVKYNPAASVNPHSLSLAYALVKSGQTLRAVSEVDAIIDKAPVTEHANLLWLAASVYAEAAAQAGADLSVDEQQRDKMAKGYASQAKELLPPIRLLATDEEWAEWELQLQTQPAFEEVRKLTQAE